MISLFHIPFRWAKKVLAGIWCLLAIFLAWLGTLPDGYLVHVRGITAPQPYPFEQIGIEIFVVGVVFSVFAWALLGKSWQRVGKIFACFTVAVTIGILAGLGSMHAPSHFAYFALSMLLFSAFAFFAAITLSIIGLIQKSR